MLFWDFSQMLSTSNQDPKNSRKQYDYSEFTDIKNSGNKLGPLVVLYIFSGVGSGIVALKRLQVAIKTVICVEDDPVASHVRMYNHDRSYHEQTPLDHIEYIDDFKTFEQLKKNIKQVLQQHGPIDLILGGSPPSNDGRYIHAFRQLVDDVKKHRLQKRRPIFFLSEANLAVHKRLNVRDIKKAYGEILPIQVSSGQFSPCEKIRTFCLNLPYKEVDGFSKGRLSEPDLDDGYQLPGAFFKREKSFSILKANSIEPSIHIDSDHMIKVKEKESDGRKSYTFSTFSVTEREKMLGFREGYVQEAVKDLFEELKVKGFNCEFENGKRWHALLHPKYFTFAKCGFNFVPSKDFDRQFYEIEIGLPATGDKKHQQDMYYGDEKYAKHLLGNAFSIAVAEVLLSPLKEICTMRRYEGFDYRFSWVDEDNSVDV